MRPQQLIACFGAVLLSCTIGSGAKDGTTYVTNTGNTGPGLSISIERGNAWVHLATFGVIKVSISPQLSIWIQDTSGAFVENVFVTRGFGRQEWKAGKFHPDSCGRDMCMPYWLGKLRAAGKKAPTKNHPLPDAVTGATPPGSFTVNTTLGTALRIFDVCLEINKSFDYNDRYTDTTPPHPFNGQPAILYKARVDLNDSSARVFDFVYAGRCGNTGSDPNLYPDREGITTALDMVKKAQVVRLP